MANSATIYFNNLIKQYSKFLVYFGFNETNKNNGKLYINEILASPDEI